ncbi:Sugar phosphate isomerase/epimerase [Rhizobiales bacterium GAS191]|nr:Sugar phosphate isomerase/epimerase [Rhizobiales bacterium GAS191]
MNISPTLLPPLGMAHFTTIDVEPLELVAMAARIGYASVGLRLYPAFPGAPFYKIPAGSALMRSMRARLADTRIRVYDIEFVTIDAAFEPEQLKPMLESAAELGARRLSLCGDDPDGVRLAAKFAELCELSDGYGMGVDIEVMAWRQVSTLQIATELVRNAGSPNGGVLVDALHLSRSGSDPADVRKTPRGFLRSAQLCDAPATRPTNIEAIIQEARGGRLPPGEGALPLRQLLAALPDDVALSVEVPNIGRPPEQHARLVYEAAQLLLAQHALAESA